MRSQHWSLCDSHIQGTGEKEHCARRCICDQLNYICICLCMYPFISGGLNWIVLWIPDAGSKPQWNESFLFTVSDSASELNLKIMDKDNFSQDDCLGEATWVEFFFNFHIFFACFFSEISLEMGLNSREESIGQNLDQVSYIFKFVPCFFVSLLNYFY